MTHRLRILALIVATLATSVGSLPAQTSDVGPLVQALWLVQRFGTADAADPVNDQKTKGTLFKALGKDNTLTATGAQGLLDPKTFSNFAGPDLRLDPSEIRRALEADAPESRRRLLPKIAEHAAMLTTSFDQVDDLHRKAARELADWIVDNHKPGQPLHVTVICTGNSRRSILGSTMGNIAAAYAGFPKVRFHSGGTAPTAFNPRTVATLKRIGVEVESTIDQAPRGEPQTPNPLYRVRWGRPASDSSAPPLETLEFSKLYYDPSNPQTQFAALMVCGEADASCPVVKGASLRVSMPYLDPKIYDAGAFEALKYDERRDDIGRMMLMVMTEVRHRLAGISKD